MIEFALLLICAFGIGVMYALLKERKKGTAHELQAFREDLERLNTRLQSELDTLRRRRM